MVKWDFKVDCIPKGTKFEKIIKFYLFECPVEGVSNRGETFIDLGWKKQKISSLCSSIKKTGLTNENWKDCKKEEIMDEIKKHNIESKIDFSKELALHTCDTKLGKTKSLFYAIRNALAHGSFSVHNCKNTRFYALETRKNGALKARIVLKEDTLIEIMKLFKEGPTVYQKRR